MKYKKISKKSQIWSMEYISGLIIAIIFLVAALFIVKELGESMSQGYDKQICKTTVLFNSKLRDPTSQIQQVDVKCPPRYITIGLDEITFESGDSKTTEDIKCRTGLRKKGTDNSEESKKCFLNIVNEATADLLFDCWDQFGAGQLRVFSNYNLDRQCLICSRIEFKKEVQDLFAFGELPISFSEFKGDTIEKDYTLDNYMRSHNPQLHEISYYEFTLDQTDAFQYPYYDYSFDKPYSAVFVAMNENAIKQILSESWTKFKSWFDDTVPNEPVYFANTLEFVPYDEVVEKCDSLN